MKIGLEWFFCFIIAGRVYKQLFTIIRQCCALNLFLLPPSVINQLLQVSTAPWNVPCLVTTMLLFLKMFMWYLLRVADVLAWVLNCWMPRCLDQTTIINVAPGTISLASYIFCQLVESQDFYQIMFSDQTVESAALFAQDWYYLVCSCNRQKLRRSSVILFYWIFNVCNYLPLLPYFDKHRSQVRISISVICGCTLFPVVKQLEKEYDRGTTRSTAGLSSKSTYFKHM